MGAGKTMACKSIFETGIPQRHQQHQKQVMTMMGRHMAQVNRTIRLGIASTEAVEKRITQARAWEQA